MPEGLLQLPPYQDPAEIERQRQEAARRQAMLQILSPPPAAGFPQAPTQGMAAPAPIPMPGPPPPPPFPRRPFAGPTGVRPSVTIDQSAPPPDPMPQTTAYQQALAEPPMLPTPIPWYKKLGAAGLAAAGGLMPRFAGAAAMGTNELTRPANEQQMLEQAARQKAMGQAAEAEQGAMGAKSQAELRAAQANEANATAAFRAQPPTDNFGSSSAGVFDKRTGKVVAPAPLQPGPAPPRMVTIPPRVRLELWPNDPSAPTELPDTLIAQLVNATKPPASPTPSAPIAGRDFPLNPDVEKQRTRMANATRAPSTAAAPLEEMAPPDATSADILSQTGLSIPAFYALTGDITKVGRDSLTRQRAMNEARAFATKRGVDLSTLPAQYKTYNTVLSGNISRLNNTKIMESELQGTIENLGTVVRSQDLGRLKFINVIKVWAGQEVNDSLAQQYALHLSQLRNELTAYYAATQGRTGNNITMDDKREAEGVIRNGIAAGSLAGLAAAIKNSTDKMGTVMQRSVNNARRSVWALFGVGGNYKDLDIPGGDGAPPNQSGNLSEDLTKVPTSELMKRLTGGR